MKKSNLKTYFWVYFVLFSLIILSLIWIFQFLFINKYYEWSKNKSVNSVAKMVKKSYNTNHYQTTLDMLSYKKDICIEIFTDNSIYYSSDSISRGCLINDSNAEGFIKYHNYLINSNKDIIKYQLINERYNTKVLLYGLKLDDNNYAFISTSLVPISSTFNVWRNLFIYITFIVLIVAFIIAYFVSKRISTPISNLNKTSKKMVNGDYNIEFDSDSIGEIGELADTLNNLKEELSKTDSLRRELMANISHDLKTPLTLIRANAEMVKDFNYDKERTDNNIKVIIDEVKRLNLLVEDILDLSQVQSNIVVLNKEDINISKLIKRVIERFKVLESDGYIINYNDNNDYIIKADKKKIEQVLYNLISNAINYSIDKIININIICNNNKIMIKVSNKGVISKSDLNHIWDKYYKIDKSYKRVTYGTGLGLSIVKNILELHQFKYGVDAKDNNICFYFEVEMSGSDGSKNIQKGGKKISYKRRTISTNNKTNKKISKKR